MDKKLQLLKQICLIIYIIKYKETNIEEKIPCIDRFQFTYIDPPFIVQHTHLPYVPLQLFKIVSQLVLSNSHLSQLANDALACLSSSLNLNNNNTVKKEEEKIVNECENNIKNIVQYTLETVEKQNMLSQLF